MKLRILILLSTFIVFTSLTTPQENYEETIWDNGVPIMDDDHINDLINKLNPDSLKSWDNITDRKKAKICYEIGTAFNKKKMFEGAGWYFSKIKNYKGEQEQEEKQLPELKLETTKLKNSVSNVLNSLVQDQKVFKSLPKSYDNVSKEDMKNILVMIEKQIQKLTQERDRKSTRLNSSHT